MKEEGMNCSQCGVELPEGAVFCHRCGERCTQDASPLVGTSPNAPVTSVHERLSGQSGSSDRPEELLWSGGYSAKAMIGVWLLAAGVSVASIVVALVLSATGLAILVIFGFLVGMWIALFLLLVYRRLNVDYQLTSQRFVHRTGILRRVTDRIEAIDMDDVSYEQGLIERMVDVGTINITSSDRSHPQLVLRGIDRVGEVAKMIDDARHKERLRRGLHIETV